MTQPSSKRDALQASLEMDRLCDEFEQKLINQDDPEILEYLDRVDSQFRPQLFEQVLPIELELKDSCCSLSEYIEKFPQFEAQIESVFEELKLLEWTDSRIDRYQVVEELGRGGMGVVFRATDPSLDRDVAIKLLTRERRTDSRWLRRFRQEARLASGLNHPNILTIHEIGEDNETPYIATEFVDGITLRRKLSSGNLRLQDAISYATQIASGMATAHRAGIIHRDLKTDNIMVRDDGLIKILDFGLAKITDIRGVTDAVKSRTGTITGTTNFMSPEQARGQPLTSATDVFSFGVVLYLMVAGKLPFGGPSISDAISQILNDHPDSIRKQGIDIPLELEHLIFLCLKKKSQLRPEFEHIHESVRQIQRSIIGEDFELQSTAETPTILDQYSTARTDSIKLINAANDLEPSEIRYAQSGDVSIAWQEIGEGPLDIVFVMGWVSHLEWFWKDPSFSNFLKRLATFARVILFDKRGTGLSDKVPVKDLPDLETRMDDVRAVMESAKSEHAVLCGISEGGPLCALFAATYPDRTIALTMIGSYARRLWAEDYPWGPTAEKREEFLKIIAESWGGPVGIEDRAPSVANDPAFREWWARYLRMGASPGAAIALTKMNAQIDVRPILPSIQVPTLVIHRTGDRCLLVDEGKHMADKIPGAKFVEFPGDDHLPFVGDADSILEEIEWFLTGMSGGSGADCVLATTLCVRISKSDAQQVDRFQKLVKKEITLYRGQNYFTDDDSLLVTFDGPVRSILCALAICRLAKRLEIEIGCGLETGTCNIDASVIYGPAVDGAKKVAAKTPTSKVWLTSTLRNLISGSEIVFQTAGVGDELFEAVLSNRIR